MNIFIAFANQDRDVRDKLLRQMNLVAGRQGWNIWSSKEIKAGEHWDDEIKQRLIDSEIVILLLSTDFFNSKYIIETELPKVVEKHQLGECQIIPVIARVCHWKETTFGEYAELGDIQALPVGEKPIVSRGHWDNEDEAYFEVVEGMKAAIKSFRQKQQAQVEAINAAALAEQNRRTKEADAEARRIQEQEVQRLREEAKRTKAVGVQQIKVTEAQRAQEWHRIAAWEQACDTNTISAYQRFVSQYPQGELALEALSRIKELKASSLPWGRYFAIGGGLLVLLLLVWLRPKIFGEGSEAQLPETPKLSASPTAIPAKKSGLDMVTVQGGTLFMGSPRTEEYRRGDECQHPVSVGSFYMGKYEVTQADWREIMGNNPSYNSGCDDCPVERVSWDDIQVFLKKLNARYLGKNYRLPTEAEWEYAARGGNKSKGYVYAGSNSGDAVAWGIFNAYAKTHPVGGKAPNELGLFDMSGNVWEWCQDTYKSYPCDSNLVVYDWTRVLRGGSYSEPYIHRCAVRTNYALTARISHCGFRIAHD